MNIIIVRTIAVEEDCSISIYNNQGIGLATALSKIGHKCALVYYAKKGNQRTEIIERQGYKIKVFHLEGMNIAWEAIYNDKLYEVCKNYDIIQTSECDQICSWLLYKHFPEKVVVYHGPYRSKYTKRYNFKCNIMNEIFGKRNGFHSVKVIAKSNLARNDLIKLGYKNVETVGVGLDLTPLLSQKTSDQIPTRIMNIIQTSDKYEYLLFIGTISERKNLKFVIKVLDYIVNIKEIKTCKLIIIGDKVYNEAQYFKECQNMLLKLNLLDNIIFLGKVEQKYLQYVYTNSKVLVLPTKYDIFGMVYLEAMYFGIPIITTLSGGSSLLINNNENGYIMPLEDIKEWSDMIVKICQDKDRWKNISMNNRTLIENNYTWDRLVSKFMKIYKEIVL